MTPSLIRHVLDSWAAWRIKARLYRSAPILRLLDAEERQARAGHRSVRPIQRQRQAVMADLLRKGAR